MKSFIKVLAITSFCFSSYGLMVAQADTQLNPPSSQPTVMAPNNETDESKTNDKSTEVSDNEKNKANEKTHQLTAEKESKQLHNPPTIETKTEHSVDSTSNERVEPIEKMTNHRRIVPSQASESIGSWSRTPHSHRERTIREVRVDQDQTLAPLSVNESKNMPEPAVESRRHRPFISVTPNASSPDMKRDPRSFRNEVDRSTHQNASFSEEKQFRERELRESQLQGRENVLRHREIYFQEREKRIRMNEEDLRAREQYYRQLRTREWKDTDSRDQALRYLLWREREMRRYYWEEDDLICHYVTRYRKVARINKRVTICERRHGIYKCFHPTRYYIIPVTRVICEEIN